MTQVLSVAVDAAAAAAAERTKSIIKYFFISIFWISTGCAIQYLIIKSERGNGIINSWLDLLNQNQVAV